MAIGAIAGHFAQKRQHKYVKKYMKNKWQWEVADLRAAGLNPILGITGRAPQIGPAGIPSTPGGDIAGTAIGVLKAKEELRLLRETANRTEAEALRTKSQTKKVELEVREFPPTVGGLARRFITGGGADAAKGISRFIQKVQEKVSVPRWIQERLLGTAKR